VGGLDLEVGIFRQCLRATTKKRSSTFLVKKCTPDKILATSMGGSKTNKCPVDLGLLRLPL